MSLLISCLISPRLFRLSSSFFWDTFVDVQAEEEEFGGEGRGGGRSSKRG